MTIHMLAHGPGSVQRAQVHNGGARAGERAGWRVVYWLLLYEVTDDYVERRGEFRERHLALARLAKARGELVLAGAFADPVDGAALVFRGPDESVAARFARSDPYVKAGLVRSWWVRRWNVVVAADDLQAAIHGGGLGGWPAPDPDALPGADPAPARPRRTAPLRAEGRT